MLKFLYRMKNRKGFTMVELIIVIAIIGVLTALILPSLLYDSKPTSGKAMAKAFFYEVQDSVASLKITDRNAFASICVTGPSIPGGSSGGSAIVVYAEIAADGHVNETGIIDRSSGSFTDMATVISGESDESKKRMYSKIDSALKKYTTQSDDMGGYLFAYIDSKATVHVAYWTDAPKSVTPCFTTGTQLTDNDLYPSGYYCAAFPEGLSRAGNSIFEY